MATCGISSDKWLVPTESGIESPPNSNSDTQELVSITDIKGDDSIPISSRFTNHKFPIQHLISFVPLINYIYHCISTSISFSLSPICQLFVCGRVYMSFIGRRGKIPKPINEHGLFLFQLSLSTIILLEFFLRPEDKSFFFG
ncbi:hypothetical protein ACB098_09G098100 [Castanea mollissima]